MSRPGIGILRTAANADWRDRPGSRSRPRRSGYRGFEHHHGDIMQIRRVPLSGKAAGGRPC